MRSQSHGPSARRAAAALAALALAGACRTSPDTQREATEAAAAAAAAAAPLTGPAWTLVRLNGAAPPPGAGGRPATLEFDAVDGGSTRAGGHAGCDRWSSNAEFIPPNRVRFEELVSTSTACVDGAALQRAFLGFISRVHTFRVTGDTLVLNTEGGRQGRFVRR